MKLTVSSKQFAVPILCWCVLCPLAWSQGQLNTLLGRLAEPRLDRRVLWDLEAHPPDTKILPALREAFEKRDTKEEKQWLAVPLMRLGERSDRYFNFLANYAKQAIEDRTPVFVKYDEQGRAVRGEFSPEFLEWCRSKGRDPKATAAVQLQEYPVDVKMLAEAEDPRADTLFRQGLASPNSGVVGYSVEALGRLHDRAAIPLIAGAAQRMHSGDSLIIVMNLPWFGTTEAYALMTRLDPDQRSRNFHINQVDMFRQLEAQRTLSRTRGTAGK